MRITATNCSPWPRLDRSQCERIHGASLEVLARTGIRLYDGEAIDLLKKAGVPFDEDNRGRIPARLVERALGTVPHAVTLYDRSGSPALALEADHSYYGPGSDLLNIIDHRTGERRKPRLEDVREAVRLCDALDNIDFLMSVFLPDDVPAKTSDRIQMAEILRNTTKPIVYIALDLQGCKDVIAMAAAVAGGPDKLRDKPTAACYINVTSSFRHNQESLQKLIFLARQGLPAIYVPSVISGVSGPTTIAGALVAENVGVLVGLVLSQLAREGAPYIVPGRGAFILDMKTLINCYCQPDGMGVASALNHYYGFPTFGLGGCSESKLIDQQAGIEAALTLWSETAGGVNLIHDVGYLESGLTGALPQLVICNEIIDWIKQTRRPVVVNDETLSVNVIESVGLDGQFLDSAHTLGHCRERWYPTVFERVSYDRWEQTGSRDLAARAARKVDEILATHHAPPLSAAADQALRDIIARAG